MKALINVNKSLKFVEDLQEPVRRHDETKIRVQCASLNPTDLDIARGDYDLFLRLYGAKSSVRTGLEFSGTVLEDSDRFRTGDRVFGYTHLLRGPKTHQQIISIKSDYIAAIPDGLSFAEAAGIPVGAQTSYVAWKEIANLQKGQRVLINGGSGGVGIFAIQIAKMLQAHVTAVAGPSSQNVMRSLGADETIDYRRQTLQSLDGRFDAILDLTCTVKYRDIKHLLGPSGIFIPADPMRNLGDFMGNPFRRRKTGYLLVDRGDQQLLAEIAALLESGDLKPVHGPMFPVKDVQSAIEKLSETGVPGRIILNFDD